MPEELLNLADRLKFEICKNLELNPCDIENHTNLFRGHIDSLDYLAFATIVEKVAMDELNMQIDLIDFLNRGLFSVGAISKYLEEVRPGSK